MLNLHCTAHWIQQVLRICVQLMLLLAQLSSQTGEFRAWKCISCTVAAICWQ